MSSGSHRAQIMNRGIKKSLYMAIGPLGITKDAVVFTWVTSVKNVLGQRGVKLSALRNSLNSGAYTFPPTLLKA